MARKSSRALWTAQLSNGGGGKLESAALGGWGKRVACDGIVLGIDPSLRGTGLAIVEFKPGTDAKLLFSQTVKVHNKVSQTVCLGKIAQAVSDALERWDINQAAIEQTIYVQNFQTAQVLGAARGACIAPVSMKGISVNEYAPLRIKQSVVGFGRASKEQVSALVKSQLGLKEVLPSDESDAAAVAICHAMSLRE